MTYNELIASISRTGMKAPNKRFLRRFFAAVRSAVRQDGTFVVPMFVSFRVITTKPRRIANPQTGKPMQLLAQKRVRARTSRHWRAE